MKIMMVSNHGKEKETCQQENLGLFSQNTLHKIGHDVYFHIIDRTALEYILSYIVCYDIYDYNISLRHATGIN